MNTVLFFDLYSWLLSVILGYVRIVPSFFMLPFFNSNVLSGIKRNAVIMIIAMGFTSNSFEAIADVKTIEYLPTLLKEFLIGVVIAIILSWPFWIFHAVGNFIDNQRGATLSSTIDPANGVDTSELANLFTFYAAAIYLSSGGLLLVLETFNQSYLICSPLAGCSYNAQSIINALNSMVAKTIVIASPVLATMLLSEFTLGLLSRFSPQLNAFSISLTIKTLIAVMVLLAYLSPIFPDEIHRMSSQFHQLSRWLSSR